MLLCCYAVMRWNKGESRGYTSFSNTSFVCLHSGHTISSGKSSPSYTQPQMLHTQHLRLGV